MKKTLLALVLALLLLLSGCSGSAEAHRDDFSIACTTYPVYLLANTIAGELDGVSVSLVIDQQVSCLHDYTLTMKDMRAVESADVVIINGAGLEDFLDDVLEGRTVIDCAQEVSLLYGGHHHHDEEEHEDEDHDHDSEEADPHIWMDPRNYAQMVRTLAQSLAQLDPERAEEYQARGEACARELEDFYDTLIESDQCRALAGQSIITFHDGFSYFAQAFDLTIAAAIEEEEGSEASARELKETIAIVRAQSLPAVFTEVDGSDKAAYTISRECGVTVHPLSMIMSGQQGDTISAYEQAITENIQTIWEAYR
ncbi:MAG: metal ABC transporter substrate-binding protein [Candidatus Onthomonas sp.]